MQNQNQDKPNHEHYPEEIDLVDVAAVMYRRKATLVLVVLFSVIVAFGYWFSLDEKIRVSAVFKIGEEAILDSGEPVRLPIMSALDSSQLLKLIYLPLLIKSNKLETGTQISQENIDINYAVSKKDSEENTAIVELFTEGSQKDAQELVAIFNASLEMLLKTHAEKSDEFRLRVRSLIETQEIKLEVYQSSFGVLLETHAKKLEVYQSSFSLFLETHAEKLDEYRRYLQALIETQKNKFELLEQVATPVHPNAGLVGLLGKDSTNIESLEGVLSELDRARQENIKSLEEALEKLSTPEMIKAGVAQVSLVEANIMSLESALVVSTNSVIIKRASAEPAKQKGLATFVAGGFGVGMFIGCFVVFFLELYAKAKIRAAETA
jgi:hypothetical protein